jgi:hypothetical protein
MITLAVSSKLPLSLLGCLISVRVLSENFLHFAYFQLVWLHSRSESPTFMSVLFLQVSKNSMNLPIKFEQAQKRRRDSHRLNRLSSDFYGLGWA